MEREVLRIYNIYSCEGNVQLIKNGNFHLFEGEIVGLVGNHHSGKSTLLGAVTGEFPCQSGRIWISEEIKKMDSIERARKEGVFLIKDESSLIDEFSIRDTMKLNYSLAQKGLKFQDHLRKCKEIFSLLNVLTGQHLNVDHGSKNQERTFYQRVLIEIAQAIICNAKILVMDSVIGLLSLNTRKGMREVFRLLVERGISIVLIENQLEGMGEFWDRLCVMRKGYVVAEMNKTEFTPTLVSMLIEGGEKEYKETKGGLKSKAQNAEAILSFAGVFTGNGILNGLSFTLYKGETLGIWNKNRHSGAAIEGILKGEQTFEKGTITIRNESFQGRVIRKSSLCPAVLPERDQLFTNMSIGENMNVSALMQNAYGNVIIKKGELRYLTQNLAEEYLGDGNYKIFIDQIVFDSPIIKKKISLCRAIASGAAIVLYRNPFSYLDAGERKVFSQDIQKTGGKGISQIIISARAETLYPLCGRILEIDKGAVVKL